MKSAGVPFSSYKEPKGGIGETPHEHVVLVHAGRGLRSGVVDAHSTYRRRSIPFHSLTVVIQKPLRKLSEDETVVMVKRISANSWARSCCTRGLSDIQKPDTDVRRLVKKVERILAVEQPLPQLGDLSFWEGIVLRIGEEQGEVFDCIISGFLV